MRSVRYLNVVLTVIALLLTLQLWTSWSGNAVEANQAHAATEGIPNAAAQRKQMVDQLKVLNSKVDSLTAMFQSGKARVSLQASDEGRK